MQGSFADPTPDVQYGEEGLLSYPIDPLKLDIEDDKLVDIIEDYEDDYDHFYDTKYHLAERRKANEIAYFARDTIQTDEEKLLKGIERKYQDNVLYEIMGTLKPLAMSRLPDLMATPGDDTQQAQDMAKEISIILDSEIKEEDNRKVLGLAYRHLPIYFTSIIKVWWDNEIDDYRFGVIHPELIKCDWTCATNDSDDMRFVIQKVPMTVETVGYKFPKAKEAFYKQLESEGLMPGGTETWALLATPLKLSEVWFDAYVPSKEEEEKLEKVSGVVWKYGKCILEKMKNPDFDYEGEKRYFSYDDVAQEKGKRTLNVQELMHIMGTGELPTNVKEEQVYHNYFRRPRKPYYFMGYDQWGKQPYDETSWVEQNLVNQKAVDRIGKGIQEKLAARGHHVLNKQAVTPAEVEEIDWDDRNLDLSVEGNPNEVHAYIPPEEVTDGEFREIGQTRERMYAIAHTDSTRGEVEKDTPATNVQIGREGDFTAEDDKVADTINPAAQWMAEWAMQFIKLRYTKDHFRWVLGSAGDAVYQRLNRNMIMEGMLVKVKASGTDKLRAQNNAMSMAKMEKTDIHSFYVDMGLSDPDGRTKKLILQQTDPIAYLKEVIKGDSISEDMAKELLAAPVEDNQSLLSAGGPMGAPQPQGGAPQAPPQNPSPQNTSAIPEVPMGPPAGSPRAL